MSNTSLLGSYGGQDNSSIMFRNVLTNGCFRVWQRGTSPGTMSGSIAAGQYVSADRWKVTGYKAGVGYNFIAVTQLTSALPAGVSFAAKVASTDAGNDGLRIAQIIESANSTSLVGRQVTISAKLKKLAGYNAASPIQFSLWRLNTVDGTPAELWGDGSGVPVGATVLQTFSYTPATSDWENVAFTTSAVLPTEAANGLVLVITYARADMGAADIFAICDAMLEAGPTATPFERRPIGVEENLCLRYYEDCTDMTMMVHMEAAVAPRGYASFKIKKRISNPTPIVIGSASDFAVYDTALRVCTAVPAFGANASGWTLGNNCITGSTAGFAGRFFVNTSNGRIAFSAEL